MPAGFYLHDFLFFLHNETDLQFNEVKEDKDGNLEVLNIEAFISVLKNTNVPYNISSDKITVVFPKLSLYISTIGNEEYISNSLKGIS